MSDRPWLQETSGGLRTERELLRQLASLEPPAGSVDRGWAALSAALPLAASAPAAAASASSVALAAKVAVGAALAGTALWLGSSWLAPAPPPSPAPSAATPLVPLAPRATTRATPPSSAEPEPTAEAKPRPGRQAPPGSSLAEEGRLLANAHRLVQQGQGAQALDLLRSLAKRYPRSVLAQEREVLTIEALASSGEAAAARARAEAFLKRHPASPHAGRLARFVP